MNAALAEEIRQIASLITARRMAEAIARAQRLIANFAGEPEAWRFYAHVAARNGAFDKAILAYKRALSLKPDDIGLHLELAQAAMACNRRRLALETAHKVAAMRPQRAADLDTLGAVFTYCEEAALALPLFETAVAIEPNNPNFLFDLAAAQRMNGRTEAAEATVENVLRLAPGDARAYLLRADLRRQSATGNHIADLERALAEQRGGPAGEPMLCYALAKELEDVGQHARSFQYLSRGAALQNARERYRLEDDLAMMRRLAERHDAVALAGGAPGFPSNEPIFVIGLPRSGTTLIERILSSHPDVSAIGESHAFGVALREKLEAHLGRPPSKLEIADLSLEVDPAELGRAYLEETRPQSGVAPRFVDKMLINYLYAGLIHRALPNAKIIAIRRHPVDSCYSMYKSLLTGQFGFTSNLKDVARYFGAWARLMDHWRDTLGPAYREVRYEDLVADPEPNIRALVAFAGLDWDDRCLSFHQSETAVTTASAAQVRRPIYTSSVGKWRAYHEQLRELITALEAEGVSTE